MDDGLLTTDNGLPTTDQSFAANYQQSQTHYEHGSPTAWQGLHELLRRHTPCFLLVHGRLHEHVHNTAVETAFR